MNQFLIIVKGSDHTDASPEKMQQRLGRFNDWVQKTLNGRFVGGAPLEDFDGRLLNSKTDVQTDGPFMESKEMISGYALLNAENIEEATTLTRQCPLLDEVKLEYRRLTTFSV